MDIYKITFKVHVSRLEMFYVDILFLDITQAVSGDVALHFIYN